MSEATIKPKIIKILCQNGEMSRKSVRLFSESDKNKSMQIKDLMEKGIIRKGEITYHYWQGDKKRKKTETRYTLYHINHKYPKYETYLYDGAKETAKKNLRSIQTTNESRHKRALRQSEVYAIMCECEIEIGDKPKFGKSMKEEERNGYYYYDSREIKEYLKEKKEKGENTQYDLNIIKQSRAMGSLYAGGNLYIVFDAEDKEYLELNHVAERNYHRQSMELLNIGNAVPQRILYTDSYDTLAGFINKKVIKLNGPKMKEVTFYDDNYYKNTLLIPKSKEGILLTYMLSEEEAKKKMDEYVGIKKPGGVISIDCDGTENNTYIFNLLYPNITRFKRFCTAAKIDREKKNGNIFLVHCYRGCENAVKEVIPDAKIQTHDVKEVYNRLLMESEELYL